MKINSGHRYLLLLIAMLTIMLVGSITPAFAATLVVDDDGLGSAGNCDDATGAFSTIAAAQGAAVSGDTIVVCPGMYTSVSQNVVSLTYLGPNQGINPNTGVRGPEAIVNLATASYRTGSAGVDPVTVSWNGFTFQDLTLDDYTTNGDSISVLNTIVEGNMNSFFNQLANFTVQNSLIRNTTGVVTDVFFGNALNVSITDNVFMNVSTIAPGDQGAINMSMSGEILRNRFINGIYYSILIAGPSNDLDIANNYFEGLLAGPGALVNRAAIRFFNPSLLTGEVRIRHNTFVNSVAGVGIRPAPDGDITATSSFIIVAYNRFFNNNNAIVHDGAGPLVAENNWYGCNEGPTAADCDPVNVTNPGMASIDFDPWLVLTGSASPTSIGFGANSTVTGSLTQNNLGPSGGFGPDGTTVGFALQAPPLGTLSNPTAPTASGNADVTFTAGMTTGTQTIDVSLDNETVTTQVEIFDPDPEIPDLFVGNFGGHTPSGITYPLAPGETVRFFIGNHGEVGSLLHVTRVDFVPTGPGLTWDPNPLGAGDPPFDVMPVDIPQSGSGEPVDITCHASAPGTATLEIDSNDGDEPFYVLNFTCNMDPDLFVGNFGGHTPSGVIYPVEPGETIPFWIGNHGAVGSILTITSITYTPSGPGLTVMDLPAPGAYPQSGTGEQFTITCDPNINGLVTGDLEITSDDANEPNYILTFTCGQDVPDLFVGNFGIHLPSGLIFDLLPGEDAALVIGNIGGSLNSTLHITSLTAGPPSGPGLSQVGLPTAPVDYDWNESDNFTVSCTPDITETVTGDLVVDSDDPDEPHYVLTFRCVAPPPGQPEITVLLEGLNLPNGTTIDFEAGDEIEFTVRNDGSGDLTLTAPVDVAGDGFDLENDLGATTLAPAATTTFSVDCDGDVNDADGTATLGSNDSDENPFVLNLHCEGEDEPGPGPGPGPGPDDDDDDDDDDDGGQAAAPPGQPALTFDCTDLGQQTNNAMTASGTVGNVSSNGMTGNTVCHVIAFNGNYVTLSAEIGDGNLISMGIVQAVDLFGLLPGGQTVVPFNTPVNLCFAGSGTIYFRAATADGSPRTTVVLGSAPCVTVPSSGTVILVGSAGGMAPAAPNAAPAASTGSTAVAGCSVTTTNRVNLREEATTDSEAITTLAFGMTLQATERVPGWTRVIYEDGQGWVNDEFLDHSGTC